MAEALPDRTYVAAIDQGTTSTRCIIFDQSGAVIASDQKEHSQIYPRPGWVEHDPAEIWQRTQEVVLGALSLGAGAMLSLVACREGVWSAAASAARRRFRFGSQSGVALRLPPHSIIR